MSEQDIKRLEQVDTTLLKSLVKGHSKTPVVFHHLEYGTLMLRHILMINRIMYHHHILRRGEEETIQRIYFKQKEDTLKGDWYELLKKDFEFIGEKIDEKMIASIPKSEYKARIKKLVEKAAFKYMITLKNGLSKIRDVRYDTLKIQEYLKSEIFNPKERNLLYSLRSRSHPAKLNYRELNSGNLKCSLGCPDNEDQTHIYENCQFLNTNKENICLNHIYQDTETQKKAIVRILRIEKERLDLKEKLELSQREQNETKKPYLEGMRPGPLLAQC